MHDTKSLIEKAIEIAGSQQKLAEGAGVRQQSIWKAKQTGRVSAELAMGIERAVGIPARDLRPDLPWPDISSSASSAPVEAVAR